MAETNLWTKYETDPRKECEGVPVPIDGVTFYVRRAGGGNRAYRYALGIASRQYMHLLTDDDRDENAIFSANEEIQMVAFARTVLIGWSANMVDRAGEPLPFSPEAALDLIQSCPAIWDQLKGAAINDELFRPDLEGEQLGKSLSGGASGASATTA